MSERWPTTDHGPQPDSDPPSAAGALRSLEINGGVVEGDRPLRLRLPATARGYADAQIDDYHSRPPFRWRPGTRLRLRARLSHAAGELRGTAGFGFWNAPFGDPSLSRRLPTLPQATWFFFASPPTDLPLAADSPGRGWFASTLDASTPRALMLAPVAPLVLALNQFRGIRRRLWPVIRQRLSVAFTPIEGELTQWHDYELLWRPDGCDFRMDGAIVLATPHSPRGPLGFVCWIDNQYLVATARGRFRWGVLPTRREQWLEIDVLELGPA